MGSLLSDMNPHQIFGLNINGMAYRSVLGILALVAGLFVLLDSMHV
jgi:hypothetical protein